MKSTQDLALQILKEMFNNLRLNLLGPQFVNKNFPFKLDNFDPSSTLGSLYTHALSQNAVDPSAIDFKTLEVLNSTALSYVDKLEDNIAGEVSSVFNMFINEVNVKSKIAGTSNEEFLKTKDSEDVKGRIGSQLKFIFNKANNGINRIVVNESHHAQSFGAMDGIIHMSQSVGISDPVVAKRGIIDDNMCKFCRELWHTPTNVSIPRVYRMSELKGGYMDRKNPEPTLSQSHPNCRHILFSVMPGFGFDDGGKIVYKGRDENGNLWDEYKHKNG